LLFLLIWGANPSDLNKPDSLFLPKLSAVLDAGFEQEQLVSAVAAGKDGLGRIRIFFPGVPVERHLISKEILLPPTGGRKGQGGILTWCDRA
jgi:hypothetical protein